MPLDAAGDREARRRARYRGNPERARFHRQSDAEEFVIHVEEPRRDNSGESLALVQGMRGISLAGHKSTEMGYVDKSSTADHSALSTCAGSTVNDASRGGGLSPVTVSRNDLNRSHWRQSSVESLIGEQSGPDLRDVHDSACHSPTAASGDNSDSPCAAEHTSAVVPATQEETVSADDPVTPETPPEDPESEVTRTDEEDVAEPAANARQHPRAAKAERRRRGNKSTAGSARRQREDINTEDIEQVVQDAPTRMTRSMARKLGVQRPRRHFGEGVSTSQILRPGGRQHSGPEP
ncbi:hypothetical protein H4R20_002278 [Coemansia guatemalensis]|uniref:Uncharacterized protein n=1 Tax=Coemansia guatemalensis TaxID=2761395 RepID=A0A9W8HVU6_9FUNG|nr:hypothetical protein H4R20_002278 [Coemansia guatemalensis]